MLRLWRATINTRNGLAFAIRSEQAVREELFALALSVPLAWLVGATMMRRVELVAAVAFVLAKQVLNLPFTLNPALWLVGVAAGSVAVALAGALATRRVLREPPLLALRG